MYTATHFRDGARKAVAADGAGERAGGWVELGRPRPFAYGGTLVDTLVDPPEDGALPVALRLQAETALAAQLEEVSSFAPGTWVMGDWSVHHLETACGHGVVSLRITADPERPAALLEIVIPAAAWGAPSAEDADRGRLLELGFEVGPGQRLAKSVDLRGPRAARQCAREELLVLTEVFGYRGQAPLRFQVAHLRKAASLLCWDAIRPSDLLELLRSWGYRAELSRDASSRPVVRTATQGVEFTIAMALPTEARAFERLNLRAQVGVSERGDDPLGTQALALANELTRGRALGKCWVEDGALFVGMEVPLSGGVSEAFLRERFLDWDRLLDEVFQALTHRRDARPSTRNLAASSGAAPSAEASRLREAEQWLEAEARRAIRPELVPAALDMFAHHLSTLGAEAADALDPAAYFRELARAHPRWAQRDESTHAAGMSAPELLGALGQVPDLTVALAGDRGAPAVEVRDGAGLGVLRLDPREVRRVAFVSRPPVGPALRLRLMREGALLQVIVNAHDFAFEPDASSPLRLGPVRVAADAVPRLVGLRELVRELSRAEAELAEGLRNPERWISRLAQLHACVEGARRAGVESDALAERWGRILRSLSLA